MVGWPQVKLSPLPLAQASHYIGYDLVVKHLCHEADNATLTSFAHLKSTAVTMYVVKLCHRDDYYLYLFHHHRCYHHRHSRWLLRFCVEFCYGGTPNMSFRLIEQHGWIGLDWSRLEGWDRSDIACIGIPDPNQLDDLKRACIIGGGPILGYRDCRL
ncbi:hypothetical protein RRG08_002640 [Elysia crispata]|uniref:Uncharacterized protein n=1 Tax=Elysia crispata TaxID=231223 RepID=A0AAE1CT77_9GAST|nr:hypothetical protein RRG08_002640 [Elysia crispata]